MSNKPLTYFEINSQTLLNRSESPSLAWFVRSLVGMDRAAAQAAFADFLNDRSLDERQIRFIELIIDQLTHNGIVQAGALYDPPFSDLSSGGPEGLFAGRENVVEGIFERLEAVHSQIAQG